jgi:tRNA pseudouridine55 synthase
MEGYCRQAVDGRRLVSQATRFPWNHNCAMRPFGFLNCDKPTGFTSRDVVNVVQRRLGKVKVGHAGTLDPLADGVLVLGVGSASRLVPYVQRYRKHYRGTFRLGAESESGDVECEIVQPPGLPVPTRQQIESAARNLVGTIQQTPPAYSAIHIDGKRAYQRIRAGEVFEMPKRMVTVDSIRVLRYEFPEVELDIVCGSGTYIRSLGIDLAREVGTVAVMSQLRRLAVGPFRANDAVPVDRLRQDDLGAMLLPAILGVQDLPRLVVDAEASRRLGHGLGVNGVTESGDGASGSGPVDGTEAAAVTEEDRLRAIVRRRESMWYPYRVFPDV